MSIVYTILSIFIALIGGSIWRFEWTGLLSNVDPATVTNKKGLARWAGACLLTLAAIAFSVGTILQFITTNHSLYRLYDLIAIIDGCLLKWYSTLYKIKIKPFIND